MSRSVLVLLRVDIECCVNCKAFVVIPTFAKFLDVDDTEGLHYIAIVQYSVNPLS